ncbi:MAG: PAS domain S-box protein [Candidatus Hydrogenedentes bacterium]|nr:PAS domain S-box protein [Candidatus Hydrogenedentota bacterium]
MPTSSRQYIRAVTIYTAAALLAGFAVVRLHLPDQLLIVIVIPAVVIGAYRPRAQYLSMTAILVAVCIVVTRLTSADFRASLNTIIATAVSIVGMAEALHWLNDARNRATEALRKSEEKYRGLIRDALDSIFTIDMEGRFTEVNDAFLRQGGYRADAVLGKSFSTLLHRDDIALATEAFTAVRQGEPREVELRVKRTGGRFAWFSVLCRAVTGPDGEVIAVHGIGRDITDRKHAEEERLQLEAQVRHVQKLESLGVLAGGIAHDFNNLLVGILGNVSLALMELPEGSPMRGLLLDVESSAQRAADLAHQMLAYSGKGQFLLRPLNITTMIRNMRRLLDTSVSKRAELRYELEDFPPPIVGDATQIEQIVMNLITNASDSLCGESGVVTIRTGSMFADRDYLSEAYVDDDLEEATYAYLEVADTGCGMDKDTLTRIFDPFFTTRRVGRGLGLAVVLGIVRGHKSAIRVQSEPGNGTTIRVLFPAADEKIHPLPEDETSHGPALLRGWQGSGTVLVADDEDMVRDVARRILERAGFQVLTAIDGRESVEVYRERSDEIALVLLDMTMPGIGGEEALREMRRVNPDVRVILSSGFSEQEAVTALKEYESIEFLQKPYQASALLEKARRLLDAPCAPSGCPVSPGGA